MCHEDDAIIMHEVAIMHEVVIMHKPQGVHYATKCTIASSECATLKGACHNYFIAGHMTSDQPDTDVDFKECNNRLLHT